VLPRTDYRGASLMRKRPPRAARSARPVATRVLYLRLIDSCITQLKAQRPSRTFNESKEKEKEEALLRQPPLGREEGHCCHARAVWGYNPA